MFFVQNIYQFSFQMKKVAKYIFYSVLYRVKKTVLISLKQFNLLKQIIRLFKLRTSKSN